MGLPWEVAAGNKGAWLVRGVANQVKGRVAHNVTSEFHFPIQHPVQPQQICIVTMEQLRLTIHLYLGAQKETQ